MCGLTDFHSSSIRAMLLGSGLGYEKRIDSRFGRTEQICRRETLSAIDQDPRSESLRDSSVGKI